MMSVAENVRVPRQGGASTRFRASGLLTTALFCTGLLLWGGIFRNESDLIAEEGIGYALGIVGLGMMTLLLTYSLRKRMPVLLERISIRRWFEIHMMLGIAGPTAILFHCNFRLGSLNSTIALVSMLLVAASGIAGRFMYTRIHHGLLGDRATLNELHEGIAAQRAGLLSLAPHTEAGGIALANFERYALAPRRGIVSSTIRFLTVGVRARLASRSCKKSISGELSANDLSEYRASTREYLAAVRRASQFSTYAWLFSLWHALHLPLCILLFAAAGIHVLAVNLY